MGGEFAQWREWSHDHPLEWHLTQWDRHKGVQLMVSDLNKLYKSVIALHKYDFDSKGFEWVDCNDWENSILTFLRKGDEPEEVVLVGCNFTPIPRDKYRIGVPVPGFWKEIFNSDAREYGGSGMGNAGGIMSDQIKWHGRENSILATLPPLATVIFRFERENN
jgi:1,4-alpha-glucan branching enzyme